MKVILAGLCAHHGVAHVLPQEDLNGRVYLQIVESRREGDQVRQQVIATLGRVDELQASGQLSGCCDRVQGLLISRRLPLAIASEARGPPPPVAEGAVRGIVER